MSAQLAADLAAVKKMSAEKLRAEWQRLYHAPSPKFSRDLLANGIAHILQIRAFGELDAEAERRLDALTPVAAKAGCKRSPVIKHGTRLIRSWGGSTHVVLVTADGYEYADCTHASLSVIAKQITGVHRSGPQFFGLRTATKGRK